jgi:AmmeMemoRadiSam system protein B
MSRSFNSGVSMRGLASAPDVRPAAVAGLFYPAAEAELRATVDALLAGPEPAAPAPKALIVPHAGYAYSGAVAGLAFRALRPLAGTVQRVVLLGPSHREWFRGLAVPRAHAFATPLGLAPIDALAVSRLAALPTVLVADSPHAREHSLEVQVPFLQRLLPGALLVPIVVGEATTAEVEAVIELVWGGPETLIVVSSDLSHYRPYRQAQERDRATAAAILDARPDLTGEDACGCIAVNGLLGVARRRGLRIGLLELRNSGDTAGDRERVVGYGAFGFYGT